MEFEKQENSLLSLSYDCLFVVTCFFDSPSQVVSFMLTHRNINDFITRKSLGNRNCENVLFRITINEDFVSLIKNELFYVKRMKVADGTEWSTKRHLFHQLLDRFPLLREFEIPTLHIDIPCSPSFPFLSQKNLGVVKKVCLKTKRGSFFKESIETENLYLITNILQSFPNIEEISLRFFSFKISDEDFKGRVEGLKSLEFYRNFQLDIDGINLIFTKFPNLERLLICGESKRKRLIFQLNFEQYESLKYLQIDDLEKVEDLLTCLNHFPNLESLQIERIYVKDLMNCSGFSEKKQFSKLKSFYLIGGITTKSLSLLLNCLPNVENFSVGFTQINTSRVCAFFLFEDVEMGEDTKELLKIERKESMLDFCIDSITFEVEELKIFLLKFPNLREIKLMKMIKIESDVEWHEQIPAGAIIYRIMSTALMKVKEEEEFWKVSDFEENESLSGNKKINNQDFSICPFDIIHNNSNLSTSLRKIEFQSFENRKKNPRNCLFSSYLPHLLFSMKNIKRLHFTGCVFQDDEQEVMGSFLSLEPLSNMKSIHFMRCKIPKKVFEMMIFRMKNLKFLDVEKNCLSESVDISEVLTKLKSLKSLHLENTSFSPQNQMNNSEMKFLRIPGNELGFGGLKNIMKSFPFLAVFDGSGNDINFPPNFCELIDESIVSWKVTMKRLTLDKNSVPVETLIQILYYFENVHRLNLRNCGIIYQKGVFLNHHDNKIVKNGRFCIDLRKNNSFSTEGIEEFLGMFEIIPFKKSYFSKRLFYFSIPTDERENRNWNQKESELRKKFQVRLLCYK